MEGQVIMAGEFNQVMDRTIDRTRSSGKSSTNDGAAIKMLTEELSQVDIWRLMNICEREYTFYSHCHRSQSRIDFFPISKTLLDSIVNCDICTSNL